MQNLLGHEPDLKSQLEILRFCIIQLNIQRSKYQPAHRSQPHGKNRNRRAIKEEESDSRYQVMEESMEDNDKDLDDQYFKNFKHPFDKMDEFAIFKGKVLSLAHVNNHFIN